MFKHALVTALAVGSLLGMSACSSSDDKKDSASSVTRSHNASSSEYCAAIKQVGATTSKIANISDASDVTSTYRSLVQAERKAASSAPSDALTKGWNASAQIFDDALNRKIHKPSDADVRAMSQATHDAASRCGVNVSAGLKTGPLSHIGS